MRYDELAAPAELSGLVHRIWFLRGVRSAAPPPFQRALPDGRAELIFNLADPIESLGPGGASHQPLALLVGPGSRAMRIRPTGRVDLVGVRFRPEAATRWLQVGGRELVDRAFALDELPASWDRSLPEQLAAADHPSRIELLRQLLTRAATRGADSRLQAAVVSAQNASRAINVTGLAHGLGLSYRQLSRLFREQVGIGPKRLARLARFQRVLRALERGTGERWAALAARMGYFDQSHLTRDFRRFAGVSPGGWLRESRELTRHFIANDPEAANETEAGEDGRSVQDAGSDRH